MGIAFGPRGHCVKGALQRSSASEPLTVGPMQIRLP